MSKALKTLGMIAGTVALIATGIGAAAGPTFAATALGQTVAHIATYAGVPARPDQVATQEWKVGMTLQNGFVCGSRVNLYCDTAWLHLPAGEVAYFHPKGFTGIKFPYALTTTFVGYNSMDKLENHIDMNDPSDVESLLESLRDYIGFYRHQHPLGTARIMAGSWDQAKRRARLHIIASDDLGFTPPGEPAELVAYASSGNESAAFHLGVERGWTQQRMMDVIDYQRVTPYAPPRGGPSYYGVGGDVFEVSVGRTGIREQIVRSWPDKVGVPITPHLEVA